MDNHNHRLTGTVQSGGTDGAQPLAGARVTLYNVTEGAPAAIGTGTTDGNGWFETDQDTGPSSDFIFYATASLPGGVLLVSVIGPELLAPIVINELTTVAAAFSLAQFIDGGGITGNPFGVRIASGMNDNLVSPLSGESSGVMLNPPNADQTNSLRSTRALANLLAPTVRSHPDAWSSLQRVATPPGGDPPGDTFQAMVNIARHPAWHVASIYQQAQAMEIYRPSLALPPDAWTLCVKVNDSGDDGQRTDDRPDGRMFGGPANISWDRHGNAWVANNVFQGTPNSGDFVVVLQPNGKPADGTNGMPKSPVVGGGMLGPGFGVAVGGDGNVWVGSFGWGSSDQIPTAGIVSKFDASGNALVPAGYTQGTVRVQSTVVDRWNNVWMASYGNDSVVVYPGGDPESAIVYPAPGSNETAPGTCTFGVAVDEAAEVPTAWVTYGAGLGWPAANPAHLARFVLEDGTLRCTLTRQVGAATKAIALDSRGNAWIASGGDDTVYLVTPEGRVSGFTDRGGLNSPWGVALDGNDDVWVANFGHLGILFDYTNAAVSRLAGVGSPSGLPVGEPISPETGYTLPTAGSPVTLADGSPLYEDGTPCYNPLMRMTSVTIDQAGNIWAVNNWKPRFGTDFGPVEGNPGGDGVVIFVGLAKPPAPKTSS
jgi:hypothetical protein